MRRSTIILALSMVLGACGVQNSSLQTLQFNQQSLDFPSRYQTEAARTVKARGGDPSLTRVSVPQPLAGASAFGKQRWYSCVAGLPSPGAAPSQLPPLLDAVDSLIGIKESGGEYFVVLVFSGSGKPYQRSGYDSALCQAVQYEAITAPPPLI